VEIKGFDTKVTSWRQICRDEIKRLAFGFYFLLKVNEGSVGDNNCFNYTICKSLTREVRNEYRGWRIYHGLAIYYLFNLKELPVAGFRVNYTLTCNKSSLFIDIIPVATPQ